MDPMSVLLHECKHFINYTLGLKYLTADQEETRTMCEEAGIRCLFRYNDIFKEL
jgi:hypothetical protein